MADGGRGAYIVSFSVVSQDTHPLSGRFTFSVGPPSAPVNLGLEPTGDLGATTPAGLALQTLARWLHLAGYALGFGSLVFGLLVLGDAGSSGLSRLAGGGALVMIAAEPVALVGQAAGLGDFPFLDQQTLADVLGSTFGLLLALRAGGALMLWSLLGAMRQPGASGVAHLAIGLGAAVAAVDGASAHALRGPLLPGVLSIPVSALHEMAMAVWVGGLAGLIWTRPRLGPGFSLRGFARLAGLGVALLAISGGLLALGHIRSPGDLVATAYGRALAIKTIVFGAALALAYAGGLRSGRPRLWRAEAAAMAAILALAGLLVSLPPPS